MKKLFATILFTSFFSLVTCFPVSSKEAKDPTQIAKEVTVRIEGATQGSGVIYNYQDGTYSVLTAWHVLDSNHQGEEVSLTTHDGKVYAVNRSKFRQLGEYDLGIIEFSSDNVYKSVDISENKKAKFGEKIYVAGFPIHDSLNLSISTGSSGGYLNVKNNQGYSLYYFAKTSPGMSGGAVLNNVGELIGIHGRGVQNLSRSAHDSQFFKTGINNGISTLILTENGKDKLDSDDSHPLFNIVSALNISSSGTSSDRVVPYQATIEFLEKGLIKADLHSDPEVAATVKYLGNHYKGDAYASLELYSESAIAYAQALVVAKQAMVDITNLFLSDTYAGLGLANKKLENYSAATAAYKESLKIDSSSLPVINNYANLLILLDQPDLALDFYSKALNVYAISMNPVVKSIVLTNIGLLHSTNGRPQQAMKAYDDAISTYKLPQAYASRGVAYSIQGDKKEGLEDLKVATTGDPTNWKSWQDLGIIYEHLGQYESAIAAHDYVLNSHADSDSKARSRFLKANVSALKDQHLLAGTKSKNPRQRDTNALAQANPVKANEDDLIVSKYCNLANRNPQNSLIFEKLSPEMKTLSKPGSTNYARLISVSSQLLNLCPTLYIYSQLKYFRGIALFEQATVVGIQNEDHYKRVIDDLEFVVQYTSDPHKLVASMESLASSYIWTKDYDKLCNIVSQITELVSSGRTGLKYGPEVFQLILNTYEKRCF